ncbi:hypothetical protein DFH94DRAFT_782801 [Russula ochroleuca]|uniref:Secreted protein n=1 Tax=Russula ochroleuca TaxID=152965 RepID=A0A9P5JVI8_9AGAM|nr:hypothetical protein DFH94DRAFT_782801 [Russula ochroleuca]
MLLCMLSLVRYGTSVAGPGLAHPPQSYSSHPPRPLLPCCRASIYAPRFNVPRPCPCPRLCPPPHMNMRLIHLHHNLS